MPNELDLPADLQHLIEKREQDERRAAERRDDDQPQLGDVPPQERRDGERRDEMPRRESDR